VCFGSLLRCGRIAGTDGREDKAVVVERQARSGDNRRRQHCEANPSLDAVQQRLQFGVLGFLPDPAMEPHVRLAVRCKITCCHRFLVQYHRGLKIVNKTGATALDGQPGRQALQDGPHLVQSRKIAGSNTGDRRATPRLFLGQPLLRKPKNCLADRASADAKRLRQFRHAESGTRLHRAGKDSVAQRLVDGVGDPIRRRQLVQIHRVHAVLPAYPLAWYILHAACYMYSRKARLLVERGALVMRKPRMYAFITIFLAAALAGCGSASGNSGTSSSGNGSSSTPISVAYFGDWESTYIVAVGLKQGFFRAAGLQVTPEEFSNGPTTVAALSSGHLDFGFIGPGPIQLAMTGHAVILGINDLSVTDNLIVNKSISSVAQLRGKSVIYAQGTVSELILDLALQQAGLKLSDVNLINIPDFPTQVSAYLSGQAIAVSASAPYSTTILQKDSSAHVIFTDRTLYPKLVMPDSWVTTRSMTDHHEATVERFMWAVEKIEAWSASHVTGSIADVAAFSKTSAAVTAQNAPPNNAKIVPPTALATEYQNGAAAKWYEAIGKVFVDGGIIKTVPPASTYLDFGPAIAASKKLGQATY
jgi:NitT/TauT family transport system substrate-binding protein